MSPYKFYYFSKQYDYKNLDPTWCCFFCHKPSHYKGLGDLFGPYYVPTSIIKPIKNITTSNSESPKKGAKRRRKSELSEPEPAPTKIPNPPQVGDKSEIWFHEVETSSAGFTFLSGHKKCLFLMVSICL